jgi:hypothetical protein
MIKVGDVFGGAMGQNESGATALNWFKRLDFTTCCGWSGD